jgi:hypothetical protein
MKNSDGKDFQQLILYTKAAHTAALRTCKPLLGTAMVSEKFIYSEPIVPPSSAAKPVQKHKQSQIQGLMWAR